MTMCTGALACPQSPSRPQGTRSLHGLERTDLVGAGEKQTQRPRHLGKEEL